MSGRSGRQEFHGSGPVTDPEWLKMLFSESLHRAAHPDRPLLPCRCGGLGLSSSRHSRPGVCMLRLWAVFGLIGAVLALSGCGSPPPTPEQAAAAVLASEPFRAARTVTLPARLAGSCSEAMAAQPEWNRWVQLGLGAAAPVMASEGPYCRFALEETVDREARNWSHRIPRNAAQSPESLVVPVAVRSLLRISDIRSLGRGVAEAAIEWQWRPNLAGQRLGIDTRPHGGWAQLALDESGWRATRVEIASE